jgi:hypothetical protein
MSGFGKGGDDEGKNSEASKIVSLLLQSIFPPIHVPNINLSQCKRVVLFSRVDDPSGENKTLIEFRHYEIATRQRNVNKAVLK